MSTTPDATVFRDRAIARALAAGDMTQARTFYDEHVRRVFSLVHRFTGSAQLSQDLTQDVFIRAFERIAQYRGEVPLGAWLRSIALSVTFNALKVRRRETQRHADLGDDLTAHDGHSADAWVQARLQSALDELPEQSRAVVVLHDVEGYTHDEVAATLGIAAGTSRAVLSQARARLRETLAPIRHERRAR